MGNVDGTADLADFLRSLIERHRLWRTRALEV